MRKIRCLVAAVLAAGIVTVVAAQPGGGFGFGGGFGDTTMMVLTNAALQDELKLTDAQKAKFKEAATKQAEQVKKTMEGMKDKFADAQGDKEKMTELFTGMQKETAKITAEARKVVDAELTAEQKKRLKEIGVQMMGARVFSEPTEGKGGFGGTSEADKATMKAVADALKLTDDQKSKIKGLVDELNKDRASVRKDIFGETKGGFGKAPDPDKQKEFNTKSAKLTKETMGKIADVMDDTQKAAWKGLVGEPFDTSKLFQLPPKKD